MTNSKLYRTLGILVGVTATCWILAYSFALLAGEGEFPNGVLAKLENRLNGDMQAVTDSKSFEAASIKKIVINSRSTDVDITLAETAQVTATFEGLLVSGEKSEISLDGDTLHIETPAKSKMVWSWTSGGGAIGISGRTPKLVLTLPRGILPTLTVNVGSGDVRLQSLSLSSLIVNSGSGDIELEGVTSATAVIKTGSGDIQARDIAADNAQIFSGSGDVAAKPSQIERWSMTAQTGSGDLFSDYPNTQISAREMRLGTGSATLLVKTGSGSVHLEM